MAGGRQSCKPPAARAGFTLLELTAVLVLAAVLATITVVSLRGTRRHVNLMTIMAALEGCDQLVRDRARQVGASVQLVFDMENNRVYCLQDLGDRKSQATLVQLPPGVKIAHLRIAGETSRVSQRQVGIACSDKGFMPSYGFALDGGSEEYFVLVPGVAGGFHRVDSQREIDEVIGAL